MLRPPGKNAFGDPLPGGVQEIPLPGCRFAPGATSEDTFGSGQVRLAGDVYGPSGADVRPTDQVRIRGDVFDVTGLVQDWGSSGVVIPVSRVVG